jgi:hypothetical protein
LADNIQRSNVSVKDPTPGNKSLLKDALSKALLGGSNVTNVSINDNSVNINSKNILERKDEKKDFVKVDNSAEETAPAPEKKPEIKHTPNTDTFSQSQDNKGKIKEVPEDILKSILE